eukprot:gene33685-43536_t
MPKLPAKIPRRSPTGPSPKGPSFPSSPKGPSSPTGPTIRPPTAKPTPFVPPSRTNYYSYNGKYYSTLADVSLNNGQSYCQNYYYYLPSNWILAPDDDDSLDVITANTWSTTTVVVAAPGNITGNGYYSNSIWGLSNDNYSNWLLFSQYSSSNGYAYNCAKCNCEILIMYSPKPKPSLSSTSTSTATKRALSPLEISLISVFSVLGVILGALYFYAYNLKPPRTQVQSTYQPATQKPAVAENDGMEMQPPANLKQKPHVESDSGNKLLQQIQGNELHHHHNDSLEPQPHQSKSQAYGYVQPHLDGQPQPQHQVHGFPQVYNTYVQPHQEGHALGYAQQGQPQPQMHGYGQPHQEGQPQVYGYVNPHLGQPQPQFYGYGQPHLDGQSQPQVYGYGQPHLQGQPQVQAHAYGQPHQEGQSPVQVYSSNGDSHLQHQPHPQGGYTSPVPQQAQPHPGGGDYHTQPQPYNPTLVYPAVAVPVYDDGHPSHAQGSSNFRP